MRFDISSSTLVLSERNLLSLLTKLYTEGSACTITGGEDCVTNGYPMSVKAEPDAVHYGDREYGPGPMHPTTEAIIRAIQKTVAQNGKALL